MGRENYTTIQIPQVLADEIDKIGPRFGYRSRAEFVTDSVRRHLDKKREEIEKKKEREVKA